MIRLLLVMTRLLLILTVLIINFFCLNLMATDKNIKKETTNPADANYGKYKKNHNDFLKIETFSANGRFVVSGTYLSGVCVLLNAVSLNGSWRPLQNIFTTDDTAEFNLAISGSMGFYRALAVELMPGREGFTNLIRSYNLLSTIAGAGGSREAVNKWQPEFEGRWATNALLSRPHIAMADRAGNIYIADKDAHAVRKVTTLGRIYTIAGVNQPGDGPDEPMPATTVALNEPNGLWVRGDGVVYILDLANMKVRRLDANGIMQTLFYAPGLVVGRGLWVSDDESLVYVASGDRVLKWTPQNGVELYATGFVELGNIVCDNAGRLVVTDRRAHKVIRINNDGTQTIIAGNGTTYGGGDGALATETGLNEVRGIWFLSGGSFFVCTHRGSQLWYVDSGGYIHLFLNGSSSHTHAGDGSWFYNPYEYRISQCRAVTMDYSGNILLTEHDSGYIRRIEFLWHSE